MSQGHDRIVLLATELEMEVMCVSSKSGHNYQCKTHQSPLSLSQMTFNGMKHNPCQPMMNINYEGGINKYYFKPLKLGGYLLLQYNQVSC